MRSKSLCPKRQLVKEAMLLGISTKLLLQALIDEFQALSEDNRREMVLQWFAGHISPTRRESIFQSSASSSRVPDQSKASAASTASTPSTPSEASETTLLDLLSNNKGGRYG